MTRRTKIALFIPAVFLAVFLLSECQSKYDKGYDKGYSSGYDEGYSSGYDEGYSSGYEDGQQNPSYPEDIASEQVNYDPERYCGDYAVDFCKNHLKYLDTIYSCRER